MVTLPSVKWDTLCCYIREEKYCGGGIPSYPGNQAPEDSCDPPRPGTTILESVPSREGTVPVIW